MSDLKLVGGADVHAETEVRRSRFITLLRRVGDEDAARALVTDARHRYPDARHHCSAFIVDIPGANRVERSSDDGEPAGTAGMPMLEVLRGSGLTDVAAVVVRYFGGIKLGTGGLVRAYSEAVQAALDGAARVRLERLGLWEVDLPHADAGRVEAELHGRGVQVKDVAYAAAGVRLTLASGDGAALASLLASLTSGAALPRAVGTTVVEHRV
ncbi:YigZ family protein [Georgenia yuyongxinii]|uniref:YigZ family protein n=1 Tax=Georgenia yuyongxinii TaxID=2589797 RepID=A0A5B8C110_9MICO|nr:YigZ family protein [Georgenia yuyongxinii]QDC24204.1 YigZ family protein [Georgenia yuyongxinii]